MRWLLIAAVSAIYVPVAFAMCQDGWALTTTPEARALSAYQLRVRQHDQQLARRLTLTDAV